MLVEVAVGSAVALVLLYLVSGIFRYEPLEGFRIHVPAEAIVVEDEAVPVLLESPNGYHRRQYEKARVRLTNKRILIGERIPFPPGTHALEAVVHFRQGDKIEEDEDKAHDRAGFGIFRADVKDIYYDENGPVATIRIPVRSERGAHQLVNEVWIKTARWQDYKRMFDLKSK